MVRKFNHRRITGLQLLQNTNHIELMEPGPLYDIVCVVWGSGGGGGRGETETERHLVDGLEVNLRGLGIWAGVGLAQSQEPSPCPHLSPPALGRPFSQRAFATVLEELLLPPSLFSFLGPPFLLHPTSCSAEWLAGRILSRAESFISGEETSFKVN